MPFPQSPNAPTNIRRPEPPGICDRCGRKFYLRLLQFQYEWGGFQLINTGLRVCPPCMDDPNPQFKAIIIGPDPVPVVNPRPYAYATQMLGEGPNPPLDLVPD